ncbi:hypothetical protein TEU_07525 [Thermococcus eurythermalis]|uniref:Uncharacterized protein n=1 Tax=Thermococcus eurythermalis TaxID=1505907 RepID=A0A097QUR5_9EURY|nr:hypothetical protein [Thermococcus eurythermalis]AIU70193.1 hypothetical protein TEU_07525 [Thermococcus eurythermalis]
MIDKVSEAIILLRVAKSIIETAESLIAMAGDEDSAYEVFNVGRELECIIGELEKLEACEVRRDED